MKTSLVLALGAVATVQGFAPAQQQRVGTELNAKTLSERIFGMDLFEPVKDQNNYGARNKKNVSFTHNTVDDGAVACTPLHANAIISNTS